MKNIRVIPVLLMSDGGLVKTKRFLNPVYIGDVTNTVKIFNSKRADEIVILDIDASRENRRPNFTLIEKIASEAFMPLGYGGGVTSVQEIERLFKIGIEKVVLNSSIFTIDGLIKEAANRYGSQSIVASLDVKKNIFGKYEIFSNSGQRKQSKGLTETLTYIQSQGIGEVIINAIDRDGTMEGYDIKLIHQVANQISVPLVALGGAGCISHMRQAVVAGASAVAAGSMFVFHGKHKAVLINYIDQNQIDDLGEL
jgi:cyclase